MKASALKVRQVVQVVPQLGHGGADPHPCHEVIYLHRGRYRVRLNRETWEGRPGDAFFYPAQMVHLVDTPRDLTTCLYVLQWTDREASPEFCRPFRVHDSAGRILMLLSWMRELGFRTSAVDQPLMQSLCFAVLRELLFLRAPGPARLTPSHEAASVLRTTPSHPFSLRELARHVDVSRFALCRAFRRDHGCSPMQYLRRLRLEKAFLLLQNTHLPLQAIAAEAGYASGFHLSALIKREFGRSPAELRKARYRVTARRRTPAR